MMSIPLLNTKSLKEKDHEKYANISFKHWLGLRSCPTYRKYEKYGRGYIDSHCEPKKVEFMFDKSIKLLVCSICIKDEEDFYDNENTVDVEYAVLVTKNVEKYNWWCKRYENVNRDEALIHYYNHNIGARDWSNTCVIKAATSYSNFLVLTDDGKIYYGREHIICQMDIKEKITCIGCGFGFYMIVTDSGKTYSWGINYFGRLGNSRLKSTNYFLKELCEVELSGERIVKVACGTKHTLALNDKGEVFAWGQNFCKQSDFNKDDDELSPIMVNIRKASDIAAMCNTSAIKSSTDELVYIWGSLIRLSLRKPIICEHTNIFDICNSMSGQSPISNMIHIYTDEEYNILNDLEAAFNDHSTSDLTIAVKEQPIYVHKTVLKIRSLYFRTMFQSNWIESNQSVIKYYHHSYVTFKTFLKYLYTGTINLSSIEELLDLLKLADEYCEYNLERDCTRTIKKEITVSNIFLINETALRYNKMELEDYCFDFFLKNKKDVMQSESFTKLDIDTKSMFITKANNFFTSSF